MIQTIADSVHNINQFFVDNPKRVAATTVAAINGLCLLKWGISQLQNYTEKKRLEDKRKRYKASNLEVIQIWTKLTKAKVRTRPSLAAWLLSKLSTVA